MPPKIVRHAAEGNMAPPGVLKGSWQRAIGSFQRALIECGSLCSLEHAQRVGILFSNARGSVAHLQRWVAIFVAEDIPPSSLLLQALVGHHQWRTAMTLFHRHADVCYATLLGENLIDSLVKMSLWDQAALTLKMLPATPKGILPYEAHRETRSASRELIDDENQRYLLAATPSERLTAASFAGLSPFHAESSVVEGLFEAMESDARSMATDPTFIPREGGEHAGYSVAAAVNRIAPRRDQWNVAVSLLIENSRMTSPETKKILIAMAAARAAHCGGQFEAVLQWIDRAGSEFASPSLYRTALHAALACDETNAALRALASIRACCSSQEAVSRMVPGCSLDILAIKVTNAVHEKSEGCLENLRSLAIEISGCASRLTNPRARAALRREFKRHELTTEALDAAELQRRCATAVGPQGLHVGRSQWLQHHSIAYLGEQGLSMQLDGSWLPMPRLDQPEREKTARTLDQVASRLLSGGKWRECLQVMESLASLDPQCEQESVLVETARLSLSDWRTALLFFS